MFVLPSLLFVLFLIYPSAQMKQKSCQQPPSTACVPALIVRLHGKFLTLLFFLAEQFSAVVAALPSLVHLAVYGASLLGDQALISITTCLPALEKLCLTETSGFTDAGLFAMEVRIPPCHQHSGCAPDFPA
jgi:hypothetical protein